LGKTCHDLDVAVSTMMGYDFAVHVNAYLTSKGYETRSIAKIDSNPDKSKHLETATTKLFDQEIDFVNLRNEIYNEDSRIPAQVVSMTTTF
jgi:tRNA nucleotidyltransferase (CCA-adding enzyme)